MVSQVLLERRAVHPRQYGDDELVRIECSEQRRRNFRQNLRLDREKDHVRSFDRLFVFHRRFHAVLFFKLLESGDVRIGATDGGVGYQLFLQDTGHDGLGHDSGPDEA